MQEAHNANGQEPKMPTANTQNANGPQNAQTNGQANEGEAFRAFSHECRLAK